MIKTVEDFNEKWRKYLEQGHYGLDIGNLWIIKYLDKEFEKEVEHNLTFSYSQLKLKFGRAMVYANSKRNEIWENEINRILGNLETATFVHED